MKKFKILILTDSAANPRSFPIEDSHSQNRTHVAPGLKPWARRIKFLLVS